MTQPAAVGLIDFFRAIREGEGALDPAPRPLPPAVIPNSTIETNLKQGVPAILIAPPKVESSEFLSVLERVRQILAEQRPDLEPEFDTIARSLEAAADGARSVLIDAVLQGNTEEILEWAEHYELPAERFYFVLEVAARPFLAGYAAVLADRVDLSVWRETFCPVCARRPSLGVIDGLNLKWLHCPACSTRWAARRYHCSLCGSDNQGTLRYLSAEELPVYRVEVCDHCRGYVKFVDQREIGAPHEIDPFLLDAGTMALDLIAQEKGYHRPETSGQRGEEE